jgi:hypothetical protein
VLDFYSIEKYLVEGNYEVSANYLVLVYTFNESRACCQIRSFLKYAHFGIAVTIVTQFKILKKFINILISIDLNKLKVNRRIFPI